MVEMKSVLHQEEVAASPVFWYINSYYNILDTTKMYTKNKIAWAKSQITTT